MKTFNVCVFQFIFYCTFTQMSDFTQILAKTGFSELNDMLISLNATNVSIDKSDSFCITLHYTVPKYIVSIERIRFTSLYRVMIKHPYNIEPYVKICDLEIIDEVDEYSVFVDVNTFENGSEIHFATVESDPFSSKYIANSIITLCDKLDEIYENSNELVEPADNLIIL